MKVIVSGLVGAAVAGRILPEVYGEIQTPGTLVPFHKRPASRTSRSEAFFNVRTPDNCTFPLEILLLQDVTGSFEEDLVVMKNVELKRLYDGIQATHPDSSFALVSFRDKPIEPLGTPAAGDFCQRFDYVPFGQDVNKIAEAYSRLVSMGGGDAPENQFGAMYSSLISRLLKKANPLAARLLVMATDAPPHFAGDEMNVPNLPPFTGQWNYQDQDEICLAEYYPGPEVVKTAMMDNEFYGAFLIFDSQWWSGLPYRSWAWFNSYIGQPSEFLQPLAGDASNFWTVLSNAIVALENAECLVPQTSTKPTTSKTNVSTTQTTTVKTDVQTSTTTTQQATLRTDVQTSATTTTPQATTLKTDVPTSTSTTEATTLKTDVQTTRAATLGTDAQTTGAATLETDVQTTHAATLKTDAQTPTTEPTTSGPDVLATPTTEGTESTQLTESIENNESTQSPDLTTESSTVICSPCTSEPCDPCVPAVLVRLRDRPQKLEVFVKGARTN